MQNYWVRRGLAALGMVLLIAFMVTTTVGPFCFLVSLRGSWFAQL
jgi:hypothetical protein